jgi:hypothetical protein
MAGDPVERDAHEGCECLLCCPLCVVSGCLSDDVERTTVIVEVSSDIRVRRHLAELMLCPEHRPSPEMARLMAEVARMTQEARQHYEATMSALLEEELGSE